MFQFCFFHDFNAFAAIASIVNFRFLYNKIVLILFNINLLQRNVDYPATTFALEVGMRRRVAVIVRDVLVDCQFENRIVLAKQAQRVVDCGARQGRHCSYEVVVNHIDRGMRPVAKEILHNGNSLCRRFDVVRCQVRDCFCHHSCLHITFEIITKVRIIFVSTNFFITFFAFSSKKIFHQQKKRKSATPISADQTVYFQAITCRD